ncbi:hypothetical protein [Mycobacterium sp. 29Ha]|uniref:hypothetical protein n=1 Tax=Mycobacterium sp. 29Ha TaxID=2939268 RepID=UPI002938E716|nr:hypothetical protein [Mycobacterium sp. 29Ha]MDV3135847.1 hypothetical protein [Mycobacterium sp. 29Ha]
MARRQFDDDDGQPWHNRTSTVLGASVLAIVVIGILIVAATAMARQFGETEEAPLDFVTPSFSATASPSTDTTTTQTITSTSPPETTDIDGPSTSPTSSSETTSSSESSTRRPTTRNDDDEDEGPTTRTTRRTPRTNITRTLNPYP